MTQNYSDYQINVVHEKYNWSFKINWSALIKRSSLLISLRSNNSGGFSQYGNGNTVAFFNAQEKLFVSTAELVIPIDDIIDYMGFDKP